MDTFINCLNNKPVLNHDALVEYESLVLNLIFNADDVINIQMRKFEDEELVYQMHYKMDLKVLTNFMEESKRLHTVEFIKIHEKSGGSDLIFAKGLNYLRYLQQEVFQLYIGDEYESIEAISSSYNQDGFPAFSFGWQFTDGYYKEYKSFRTLFKDLKIRYQTRGWKLSNFL